MKSIIVLATALLIGACTATTGPAAAPRTASTSAYGQCVLEGSACGGASQCCSGFCANYECVTRDP